MNVRLCAYTSVCCTVPCVSGKECHLRQVPPVRHSAHPWLHVHFTEHDRSAHPVHKQLWKPVCCVMITVYAACRLKRMACLLNFHECDCSVIMFKECCRTLELLWITRCASQTLAVVAWIGVNALTSCLCAIQGDILFLVLIWPLSRRAALPVNLCVICETKWTQSLSQQRHLVFDYLTTCKGNGAEHELRTLFHNKWYNQQR